MLIQCPTSRRRVWRAAALLAAVLAAAGCQRWLGGVGVPEGFARRPEAARLLDPATRMEAYRALFPPLERVDLRAELTARGRWWQGSERMSINYAADAPAPASAPARVRMRGYRGPGSTLFDLLVRDGRMTVVLFLPDVGAYFEGPIPADGSPFRRRYGVEPWDLAAVFTIGQRLAESEWFEPRTGGAPVLEPRAPAPDGLVRVALDRRSGLPRAALWRRGGREWEVAYRRWMTPAEQPLRLMPGEVEVRVDDPPARLTLRVEQYRLERAAPPALFLLTPPAGRVPVPLERLDEVLR